MKKVILGTTFIASLLLAGGVNAFAVTDIPDPMTIPIELEYANNATFEFNEISLTAPVISESIFEGPVEGTISVVGTLTNLTASEASVKFVVNAPDDFNEIVVDATNLEPLTAAPVDTASIPEGTEITFTIDQTFAKEFAKLEEDEEKPVITIIAQDDADPGETPSL